MTMLVTTEGQAPRQGLARARAVLFVAGYVGLLVLGNRLGASFGRLLELDAGSASLIVNHQLVWGVLAIYAVLRAVPFLPAAQLALAMLAAFGGAIAVQLYIATVVGLTLAFLVGRLVPIARIASGLSAFGLQSAASLVGKIGSLDSESRLAMLFADRSPGLAVRIATYRHTALIAVFNLPGNCVMGGGGGIGLLAGLSGLFTLPGYIACVAVAALPIPLVTLLASRLM